MKNVLGSAIVALVAAASSVLCARLNIPVWTMFAGWIAFVAGGMSARTATPTVVCAVLGVVLGMIGATIISGASNAIGSDLALLAGVFVIVLAALLAQGLPFAKLVICYFIGMTTFFASGLSPEPRTALLLSAGLLAGVLSGLFAVTMSSKVADEPAVEGA